MGVAELRSALQRLATVHRASGAKQQADDIDSVAKLLDETRHRDVDDAAREISAALNPTEKLVAVYVDRLTAAGTDRILFDPLFAEIKADKSLGKTEMEAIAGAYSGVSRKWKSKAAALDEIESTFVSRAYQANKMKIVEQYKGW